MQRARLHPAASVEDFVGAPHGKWLAGRMWLAFCLRESSVCGFILWGRSDDHDAAAFVRTHEMFHSSFAEPSSRYIDIRHIEVPNPSSFAAVTSHWAAHADEMARVVTRAAVVHSGGLGAALAAGVAQVIPFRFPMQLFTDPDEACRWLNLPADCRLVEELAAIRLGVMSAQLLLGPEARWFRVSSGDKVSLSRTRAMRLVLLALARAHLATPGRPVSVEALFESGWPTQRIRPDARAQRVYVAIATLRKLGLRAMLERHQDGYLLRSNVNVTISP